MKETIKYRILEWCFRLMIFLPLISYSQKNSQFHKEGAEQTSGFIENKGQIIDQNNKPNPNVLYLLNSPGMNVQLRRGGFSYDVYQVYSKQSSFGIWHPASDTEHPASSIQYHRIDFNLVNFNPIVLVEPSVPSSDYQNYYTSGTGVLGITSVHSFQSVTYKNIWPGIDLEFMRDNVYGVKYNFVVHPGADMSSIQMNIKGPEICQTTTGSLLLETTLGTIEERIPECYYIWNNERVGITGNFTEISPSVFGFFATEKIPSGAIITIDPVPDRLWGTYYGGSASDVSAACSSDPDGNVFITGQTFSSNNIATAGSFQSTLQSTYNAFLVKFDSTGQRIWGTYYGGATQVRSSSCAADKDGNIYMTGDCGCGQGANIATPGCYQDTCGGGTDIFLTKFNSSGSRIWGTYFGGSYSENTSFCATDRNENVYLAFTTNSPDTLSTPGVHQIALSGQADGILARFDSSGQRIWSTYYGGEFDDYPYSCATDGNGHVYISGFTRSLNGIASPGCHQPAYGGIDDCFLASFDTTGQLLWGTYYGGSNHELYGSCAISPGGDVYLSGQTSSFNNISTSGTQQPAYGSGAWDGFLAKFDVNGMRQWGTYYGGSGEDVGWQCTTDINNNVILCGHTSSFNNISTPNAFQPIFGGGGIDAFLVKFNPGGQRMWGTYYGGSGDDDGKGLCIDINQNVYLTSGTSSLNNMATPGAQQTTYGGGINDAYLIKFKDCPIPSPAGLITGITEICLPASNVSYSISAINYATGYLWSIPGGATIVSGINTPSITVDFSLSTIAGRVSVQGTDTCANGSASFLDIHIHQPPVITIQGKDSACVGQQFVYKTQTGMSQYMWTNSTGGTIITGGTSTDSTITISWDATGNQWIQVNFNDTNGCSALMPTQKSIVVSSGPSVLISIAASNNNVCNGTPVTFTATPTSPGTTPFYQWKVNGINVGTNTPAFSYTPLNGDQVNCVLTSSLTVCISNNPATSNTITMIVNPNLPVSVSVSPTANPVCAGTSVTFTASPTHGGVTPTFLWKVNGTVVGSNNPTYAYIPLNNDVITCTLTSSETCITGNPTISNQVTMIVNPNLPVSISISASSNPFCIGGSVTFIATPTHGGTTPNYQWKVNGLNAGTNNSTYTYNPTSGDIVTCVLTSSDLCVTGNPATSNTITMIGNLGLPAGVTITATPNPFCPGTTVAFTATPNNGGSNPAYQWKVNGANAGSNSFSFTYNPVTDDKVTCLMTSNLACVSGNPALSNEITLSGTLAPIVSFTTCFDTVTTINAKPIKLKGGIPLNGTYTGPGVSANTFNPAAAGVGTKTITYSYTNAALCSASKTKTILVQATPAFICGSNLTDIRDGKS
ncbi:MAG: hypothetical protein WCL00_03995, partial [Bacteroidota bacterium]